MGGKHKQAQRTKNNVRPSSSGRSAELLGTNVSSFVGFSAFKEGGYVPALPGFSDEIYANINPNFHLVLKKMNKKDSVTKLKALNEFGQLCSESEPAAVKAVLPFWPRLYCVLASDTEHRVREAAHNAHRAVVSSVGRSIAPYLKVIAGAWFTSQYDTYPPAASAASLSFQETFPPNKLTEAIIFCQEEILNYIIDNLINQTAQTLSSPKVTTPEEMETKYQRVVVSSLHGYAFYLSKLPEEQLLKAEELNKKLIGNSKFWKFAKHSASIVRVAWFTAIVNLCQKAPFFLSNEKKHVVLAVFNSLDDVDSVVLPVVWRSALHVVDIIKDCWEYVSAEKLVFPKLWRILKEGGIGSASSIFPHILPLLSKIPSNLIPNKQVFYSRFFSSLQEGLKLRHIQMSIVESEAVAECYIECLNYVIMLNVEELEFCHCLISEQLMTVIELTLKNMKLQLFRRALYNRLAWMIVQWSKQELQESYSRLLSSVLNKLVPLCFKLIDESALDRKQLEAILHSQADLICAFKCSQCPKQRKRMKVTFLEDKSSESETPSAQSLGSFFEETPSNFQYEVNNFVRDLVKKYFECISSIKMCKHLFVRQLAKVITVFDSKDMFIYLISLSDDDEKTWNKFYSKYITEWLKDREVCIDNISQLIFTLLKYVQDEDEKQNIFHSMSQTETKKVLEWCLKNENANFSSVKQWLMSDKMDSIILSIIEEAVSVNEANSNNASAVVKSCLRQTEDKSILIKHETVISILKYLQETVKNYEDIKSTVNIDIVADLIALALNIFQDNINDNYKENIILIILECFKFSLIEIVSPCFDKTWQDCVSNLALIKNKDSNIIESLTLNCAGVMRNLINERSSLKIGELRHAVQQCVKYLMCLERSEYCDVEQFSEIFLKEILFQNENHCVNYVLQLCYCGEVIKGTLSLPLIEQTPDNIMKCHFKEIFSDDLMTKFVMSSLFSVLLLLKILGVDQECFSNESDSKNIDNGDCEDDENLKDYVLKNVDLNTYTVYLADSILKVAASSAFKKCFSKSKQFFESYEKIECLEKCTKELVQRLDNSGNKDVEHELILRGSGDVIGGICAEALFILHSDILGSEDFNIVIEKIINENKLIYSQSDILSIWLPQVFAAGSGFQPLNNENSAVHELSLLCCNLQKLGFKDNSPFKDACTDWLDKVLKFGKLPTFEVDLSSCSLNDIQLAASIAEFLSLIIQNSPADITDHNGWDFALIATASWILSLKKTTTTSEKYCTLPILQLLNSVCHLFKSISNHMSLVEVDGSQLKTEWNDVFLTDVNKSFIDVWVNIADGSQDEMFQPVLLIILDELAEVIANFIDVSLFVDKSNISHWLEICSHHIQSSVSDVQSTAYTLLMKMTPSLVALDSECEESKQVDLSFKHIEETLKNMQSIVDTMLSDFKLGDTCIVEPFTDCYIYTRGYLFLWLVILEICNKVDSQIRFMYSAWIKENMFLGSLMKCLFCLMPEEAVHGHEGNIKYVQELFSNPPKMSEGFWESKTLAHLSCWTYYKLLSRLPAEVRQWWSEIDHRLAIIVDRLTATFVSPILCSNEMKTVRSEGKNFQNMTVRTHPAAREVVAVYVVEESSTELVIQLPLNYPLGPTKVESGKCIGSTNQTRQWLMQLSLSLNHQNVSIWDALSLWKNLFDKKFEGVEECYICFAILHNVTQQLPKLTCHTCKKKFHTTCLYRWFTTSNASTCPICRNYF
ncbi:E3 ubiquitin-protein ligase listerin [Lycorma delicatula]|uniref:E3 ubiquitin-protein ligase listerin n=1 Tax=Lycorma delicatula TaxID=130591 RepID=UPI003F516CAD